MLRSQFIEGLESRRMMSVAPTSVEAAPLQTQQAHVMSLSVQAKKTSTPAPVFNVSKFAGDFREKTTNIVFVSTLKITVVKPSGAVRGKLTIPGLFSNVPVKGRVGTDGRFRLQYATDFASDTGLKGYYNGKVSMDGKALSGTMAFDWSGQPTGVGFKISFLRPVIKK